MAITVTPPGLKTKIVTFFCKFFSSPLHKSALDNFPVILKTFNPLILTTFLTVCLFKPKVGWKNCGSLADILAWIHFSSLFLFHQNGHGDFYGIKGLLNPFNFPLFFKITFISGNYKSSLFQVSPHFLIVTIFVS